MRDPEISLTEAQAIVETKTAPRVTEASIKSRIKEVSYFFKGTFCICFIEMVNGYKFIGKSAPASAVNFDRFVGERYAYEDAFKQIWGYEAYLLLEQLSASN
jgi:hypothetical protein